MGTGVRIPCNFESTCVYTDFGELYDHSYLPNNRPNSDVLFAFFSVVQAHKCLVTTMFFLPLPSTVFIYFNSWGVRGYWVLYLEIIKNILRKIKLLVCFLKM